MNDKREVVATQIRLPSNLHSKITEEAKELNVSINAHMIELIDLGIRFREADIIIQKATPP